MSAAKTKRAKELRRDMTPAEFGIMLPLLVLIVFLGVYPTPMLERM